MHQLPSKERLEKLRDEFGSQHAVASHIGCSQMTISRLAARLGVKFNGRKISNKLKGPRHGEILRAKYASGEMKPYWSGKKCSAEHVENRVRHLRGKPTWNTGRSTRITSICQICQKPFDHGRKRKRLFCGRECSAVYMSNQYSDGRLVGKRNPNYGNDAVKLAWLAGRYNNRSLPNYTRGKGSNHGGAYLRSSWEKQFATDLDEAGVPWTYEVQRFLLSDGRHYTPDFSVWDWLIEIKGHWYPAAKKKFVQFRREYPDVKILVLGEEWWKARQTTSITKRSRLVEFQKLAQNI